MHLLYYAGTIAWLPNDANKAHAYFRMRIVRRQVVQLAKSWFPFYDCQCSQLNPIETLILFRQSHKPSSFTCVNIHISDPFLSCLIFPTMHTMFISIRKFCHSVTAFLRLVLCNYFCFYYLYLHEYLALFVLD